MVGVIYLKKRGVLRYINVPSCFTETGEQVIDTQRDVSSGKDALSRGGSNLWTSMQDSVMKGRQGAVAMVEKGMKGRPMH